MTLLEVVKQAIDPELLTLGLKSLHLDKLLHCVLHVESLNGLLKVVRLDLREVK